MQAKHEQTADGRRRIGGLIRKRRKALNMTLKDLARVASVSVGYLSQVERDNAVPTLGTLAQIADGLDMEIGHFVSSPRATDAITRSEGRPRFSLPGSPIEYETLTRDRPGADMSGYIIHIPPGYASETVSHPGDELVLLLDGEIEQVADGEVFRLGPGDSFHFDGETPHAVRNVGTTTARILWAGTLDVLQSRERRRIPRYAPANDNA